MYTFPGGQDNPTLGEGLYLSVPNNSPIFLTELLPSHSPLLAEMSVTESPMSRQTAYYKVFD